MKVSHLLLLIAVVNFASCASYIDRMHQELDAQEGVQTAYNPDNFEHFRSPNQMAQQNAHPNFAAPAPRQMPRTTHMEPMVKRNYRPIEEVKKRYNADDLTDSQNDASLWAGAGKNNFLFGTVEDKRNGDIVLIQVAGRLKNEITLELKRAFPESIAPKPAADGAATPPADAPAGPAPASADAAKPAEDVYDRISSVIVEHINTDHLLLRGRKHVLYKDHKRLIEVQALVARRDISGDDTVNSDKILETSIVVLR